VLGDHKMTWVPKYTSIQRIETELSMKIDSDTVPNETEVLNIIEEVENEIDSKLLYRYHLISGYIDVEPVEGISEQTAEWIEYISRYDYSPTTGRVVIPNLIPIISIDASGVHTRESALGATTSWNLVQEGLDKDFIQLKKQTKDGQELGFALYFFNNAPAAGLARVRASYWYGYNINKAILRKYATKKVALEVLSIKQRSSQPAGLTQFRGGDLQSFVGTQYDSMVERLKAEIEEIETKYFPEETGVAMGII